MTPRKAKGRPPDMFGESARARMEREAPLAARMRPRTFDEFVGQEHLVGEGRMRRGMYGRRAILFIDEIHRFNKAQQDVVLPHVEDATITLIGATTENPSFEVIGPLLSRCRVYTLNLLPPEQMA